MGGGEGRGSARRRAGGRYRVVACLVAWLAGCAAPVPTSAVPPPSPPTTPSTVAGGVPAAPVRVLQLNLCGSGIAACYTGRSTAEAAAVLRAVAPDLVTLNEVCADDVSALERALADVVPGGAVASAFQAARDRRTGEAYLCRDGAQYGIGVVTRWPAVPGSAGGGMDGGMDGGIYPAQDGADPEERAWLCLDAAPGPPLTACTTHLAYTDRAVAAAQCRYLFDTVVARLRARHPAAPLVLGGDLNLGSVAGPELAACLPVGSAVADDGGQQHVVATAELVVESAETVGLRGSTDHPGLLVTLAARSGR